MIQRELSLYFFIMLLSMVLFSCERQGELRRFYRPEKTLSLGQFKVALKTISKEKKDHLALWHSMLTGNTRSLSKDYKEKYKNLGLSHIFTPSGFHLSALLSPLRLVLPFRFIPYVLALVCFLTFQLPGQDALKRMSMVKVGQNYLGKRMGFSLAMFMALMMGQLNTSPLSFIFSLFFLGVIFSELKGLALIIWFFLGQILITFLSGGHVSLLNLLFSPIANLLLTLITPFLFLLSFPLSELQLQTGLKIIEIYDIVISFFYEIMRHMPQFEVHTFTIVLMTLTLWRKSKALILGLILFSSSLNLEKETNFRAHRYYFLPQGELLKITERNGERLTYYADGKCMERLRMGIWEKRCSPKRAPVKRKIKKLSYR
ncbi:MAG TPA: ComEC/Rec2 family competence protein [Bacteriovoracaceae bacterium]|nr:ComEC/Rec2 family competence protein [Bacteriovoracaceae bacterium]